MRKLVVDASVCIKWAFNEEGSEMARQMLQDYRDNKILLVSPDLWEYEITNVLASAVKRKKISSTQSFNFLELFLESKPEMVSISDILNHCLENAQKYEISAYDSAYVTLAKENNMVLISADDKLVAKVNNPKIAILLRDY